MKRPEYDHILKQDPDQWEWREYCDKLEATIVSFAAVDEARREENGELRQSNMSLASENAKLREAAALLEKNDE